MKKIIFAFIIVYSSLLYSQTLTTSLTACYAFSGNAIDPISSLNGTLSSATATVDRFNNANSAYAFSGVAASNIELPDNLLLKPTAAVSFCCWIKVGSTANQYVIFTKNPTSSNFEAYSLAIVNGVFKAQKGDGLGGTVAALGTTILNLGSWYHVVVTIDNSMIKLYVDGLFEDSAPVSFPFAYQAGKKVVLGGSNESFNLPFTGHIDNLRFYNRILSASEVTQIYNVDPVCVVPVALFSVSPPTLCIGSPVTLTDLSSNSPNSWSWQITGPGTFSFSTNTPTMSFVSPGTYTISLVAGNTGGNSAPVTQTILVRPSPTVSAVGSVATLCKGETATLTVTGAVTYTWSTGSSTQQQVVTPTATTMYTVTGTSSLGCTNTASVIISTTPGTLPSVSLATSNTLICAGQTVTLSASGAATYVWSNNSAGPNITVNPTVTTTYIVTGTLNGCAKSASVTQAVVICPGIRKLRDNEGVRTHPNPGSNKIEIESVDWNDTRYTVINSLGQIVCSGFLSSEKTTLDIHDYPNGLYFVALENSKGTQTYKFVKQQT